ncbi:DUF2214 family protein [bacterium]|nr:DUF2214 family protein [bacterium]
MEVLIPGVLILHIFSMLMWFGSILIQYVFLSDIMDGHTADNTKLWSMDLIGRMNKTILNIGLILAIVTGVSLIFIHGAEWFRPRTHVHIKITLGLIAAGLSHMAMAKFRKANELVRKENPTAADLTRFAGLMGSWKLFTTITLVVLATIVITAVFKFGL